MATKITPCLFFKSEALEAATFYVSIFPSSKITSVKHHDSATGGSPGNVLLVSFTLNNQPFTALNGSPSPFNEAMSLQIECEDQAEVDHFWEKLKEGGDETKQQCGWVVDRWGVHWQVIPKIMGSIMGGKDKEKSQRAFKVMMGMKKLDVEGLKRAYDGVEE